ncbi:MAG: prolyl oligopeptidase family serine peptidase [Lentisphaerae bacterium]|nr:prolyl oligopeptidase family serine peptidase [Lentisphaerota bacterium]
MRLQGFWKSLRRLNPPLPARPRAWLAGVFCLLCLAQAAGGAERPWRDWAVAKIRMHVQRAADLRRYYYDGYALDHAIAREQDEVRQCLLELERDTPPPWQPGIHIEAYISEIDDSAQPFWRYLPPSLTPASPPPPLLVFLHGYDPSITFASFPCFPTCFTNVANRTGALIAAPFGRGNTDYQHIGEQDVLRVIDEMRLRYHADPQRVVLCGNSMGGLGVWNIGARWADRFNALMPICGRGDFYVWHELTRAEIPGWHRELVDTQFATLYLRRLLNTPVFATHGRYDDIVTYEQGAFPVQKLRRLGSTSARLLTFTDGGHDIFAPTWYYPPWQQFLETVLTQIHPKPPPRSRAYIGTTGSRLQDALLKPFVFVGGDDGGTGHSLTNLRQRAHEWRRFAFALPRMALETALEPALATNCNLFVFGEPETSPLVARILQTGKVGVMPDKFLIAGRELPRDAEHGLWFTGRNPFNTNRTAVVQSGIAWGGWTSDNHRYDRIPDVIVYTNAADRWGYNVAVAAGFVTHGGDVRWSDPPFTEAIRRPPDPPPWPDYDYFLPYTTSPYSRPDDRRDEEREEKEESYW